MIHVIKLGGSLVNRADIMPWLKLAAEQGAGQLVIVPGGGLFADCVRQQQQQLLFSNAAAHVMAIMAMQQMARVFQDLQPELIIAESVEQIHKHLSDHQTVIWSPDIAWLSHHQIPASWDISSDSLAAFLATQLAAEHLVLVKSVAIAEHSSPLQWAKCGIVDKEFPQYVENSIFNISLLHKSDLESMLSLLTNPCAEY